MQRLALDASERSQPVLDGLDQVIASSRVQLLEMRQVTQRVAREHVGRRPHQRVARARCHRQREIAELFRLKKPKLNEQSTHATGELVPPTIPHSSIPTVTENDKIDDLAAAAGLGDTEVTILMSPVKSSQNRPSDTETKDSAIAETVVAAVGAPMAAEPPGTATEGSMGRPG
jgi:hypothetical protein